MEDLPDITAYEPVIYLRLIIPLFIKKDEDLMKRLTRIASISMASMLAAASLVACSGSTDDEGDVYFLNFKPEQDAAYQEIAKAYTEETGVKVKVVTAASGSYEQTLKAEIGKDEAPSGSRSRALPLGVVELDRAERRGAPGPTPIGLYPGLSGHRVWPACWADPGCSLVDDARV